MYDEVWRRHSRRLSIFAYALSWQRINDTFGWKPIKQGWWWIRMIPKGSGSRHRICPILFTPNLRPFFIWKLVYNLSCVCSLQNILLPTCCFPSRPFCCSMENKSSHKPIWLATHRDQINWICWCLLALPAGQYNGTLGRWRGGCFVVFLFKIRIRNRN